MAHITGGGITRTCRACCRTARGGRQCLGLGTPADIHVAAEERQRPGRRHDANLSTWVSGSSLSSAADRAEQLIAELQARGARARVIGE
jgi:hypothetical protein